MKIENLSRSEIEYLIDEWIFNERDRAVLKRRLLDGIKYEALAEEFDLIVYKSENRLFIAIEKIVQK